MKEDCVEMKYEFYVPFFLGEKYPFPFVMGVKPEDQVMDKDYDKKIDQKRA